MVLKMKKRFYIYTNNSIQYFKTIKQVWDRFESIDRYDFTEAFLGIEVESEQLDYCIGSIDVINKQVVYLRDTDFPLYKNNVFINVKKDFANILKLVEKEVMEIQGLCIDRKTEKVY